MRVLAAVMLRLRTTVAYMKRRATTVE